MDLAGFTTGPPGLVNHECGGETGLMPIARTLFALLLLGMAAGQLLSFSVFVEAIAGY